MSRIRLIVNPAAGRGRCVLQAGPWHDRLVAAGHEVQMVLTEGPGHGVELAAEPTGAELVVAVGGDGTLHEVVNGLVRQADPPALGLLPLGTGNSFGRDFGLDRPETAFAALVGTRRQAVDLVRLDHAGGALYSINLVSLGFVAEVGALANRRFKALSAAGYVAAVLATVIRLERPTFAIAVDDGPVEREPCVFLCFSNSRFTGGGMEIAPSAVPTDGLVDLVRVGPMGRRRLLRLFPRIFQGTHVQAPEIGERQVRRVRFEDAEELPVLVDGEVLRLRPRALEVVPGALELAIP